jgi:hypothetical protein
VSPSGSGENPEADDDLRAEPLDELPTPPAKLTIVYGQHTFATPSAGPPVDLARCDRLGMPASHEGKPNSMNLDAAIFCSIAFRSRFRYSSSSSS